MTVSLVLRRASERIGASVGLDAIEAAIEARALLCAALDVDRVWLIVHAQDELEAPNLHEFEKMVERRLKGEPVAYIAGFREFYGAKFRVTRDVLIPRPETELLVDLALECMPEDGKVLDLGTGSGAIAVSIARLRKSAAICAIDKSPAALEIAKENGRDLPNIDYVESDWFEALPDEKYDLIVSNPPYIAEGDEHLKDLQFEPSLALTSGRDGLDAIRRIVQDAPSHLKAGGWLLFEHGYDQGGKCRKLLSKKFYEVATWRDLSGNDRVSGGRLTSA